MVDLFSFDDVLNSVQAAIPKKKCGKKQLVKADSLSQNDDSNQSAGTSSQAVLSEVVLPLFVIPAKSFPQVEGSPMILFESLQ